MRLTGLHFLLTYQCTFECDHCFVWGSPRQSGVFTLERIEDVLVQAKAVPTIRRVYFEGGEPFLYYPVLLKAVQTSYGMGFENGIVTNGYWATTVPDAMEWLKPMAGLVVDLSVSSDLYHYEERLSQKAKNAREAAGRLGIPVNILATGQVESARGQKAGGDAPGEGTVMFRGRAAAKLTSKASKRKWSVFTECPHEDLRNPGRVHVDPYGDLHVCQGLTIGNVFRVPLKEIIRDYRPERHPVIGPLLKGGPAALVREYGLEHRAFCADACHLCYESRERLRGRFPETLLPDQMYGDPG